MLTAVVMAGGAGGRLEAPPARRLREVWLRDELVAVDVSHEPFDGDPAHSGDSIVRDRLSS